MNVSLCLKNKVLCGSTFPKLSNVSNYILEYPFHPELYYTNLKLSLITLVYEQLQPPTITAAISRHVSLVKNSNIRTLNNTN